MCHFRFCIFPLVSEIRGSFVFAIIWTFDFLKPKEELTESRSWERYWGNQRIKGRAVGTRASGDGKRIPVCPALTHLGASSLAVSPDPPALPLTRPWPWPVPGNLAGDQETWWLNTALFSNPRQGVFVLLIVCVGYLTFVTISRKRRTTLSFNQATCALL